MTGRMDRGGAGLFAAFPGWRRLAMAGLAGLVMATGQAPLGWWFLALPALAVLLRLLARAETAPAAAWLGWFGGGGYFLGALNWIVEPFLIEPEVHGWMAPFALVLMCWGLGLFWAAAAWAGKRGRRPIAGLVVALALAELARGYVLTGFPWAQIGQLWIGHAPMQLAAWIGPAGLTLLALSVAGFWAAAQPRLLVAGAGLLGAAFALGAVLEGRGLPADRDLRVRLVQPNAEQGLKWDPERARFFFERQLAFTAADPRPDLTIWPETAVPYLLEDYPEVGRRIAAAGRGSPVAVGVQRVEGWRFWNSLAVIGPDGLPGLVYDKHHLVPFGEYVPFGDQMYDWFGLVAFAAQQGRGYSAGTGAAVLDLGPDLGLVLPLICYEAVFPQIPLAAPGRADWILQVTNDAWFGQWTGPYQHLAQARLRAVEQGLPVIRVANTGVSAVIDARGRVVESLALGEAGFLDVSLPAALPPTPYARTGDGPMLLLLALLALWLTVAGRRKAA